MAAQSWIYRHHRRETGAGKSIIIGALQLLLGDRTDKSLIRTGADVCAVEAVFEGAELEKLNPGLSEAGIEPCEGELIVKRSFSAAGTNRQFINGSPATLAALKNLGDELVDLHGPHDHQSLLSPDRQLALLDGFANAEATVREFEQLYRKLQALRTEHAALSTAESAREQEISLLRHQVNEIVNARLSVTEEEEIAARYKLAANSKRLVELSGTIARRLSEADDSILPQLAETQRLLRELEKIDPAQGMLAEAHAASIVELSEISRSLSHYAEELDLDPEQLAALEERVSLFETLKRKYGGSIAEVITFGEQRCGTIAQNRRARRGTPTLDQGDRSGAGRSRAKREGPARSCEPRRRRNSLKTFAPTCATLVFGNPNSKRNSRTLDEARATGFDTIELLFSPNPGEPLKPLRTIASSGEISRLMLAIKSSLAEQDAIPLLVFDEIDANVGGEIANAVGAKMRKLAGDHQVLCITHLPQVAAAATTHFVVTKEVTGGRTHSRLSEVAGKARTEEIARMLGGKTESALKHAATLLKQV